MRNPAQITTPKIADVGYSLRIKEHLEQMSHLPDHLRHECENGVIRAVLQSIKRGISAEMMELEPLQNYIRTHSDFAIGLCCCMASRLEEMQSCWDSEHGIL